MGRRMPRPIRRYRTRWLGFFGRDSRTRLGGLEGAAAQYIGREDATRAPWGPVPPAAAVRRYPVSSPPSTGSAIPLT